jgi:hypothetical protein
MIFKRDCEGKKKAKAVVKCEARVNVDEKQVVSFYCNISASPVFIDTIIYPSYRNAQYFDGSKSDPLRLEHFTTLSG